MKRQRHHRSSGPNGRMHLMLVYKLQLLPMVWLKATFACGLIEGDFCLWFDWGRLLPVVWLKVTYVCGLIDDYFCMWFNWGRLLPVVWLRATSACGLIDELYPKKWRILPVVGLMATSACGWLMGFIPRNGDFCQWFDWWRLLPKDGLLPLQWFN